MKIIRTLTALMATFAIFAVHAGPLYRSDSGYGTAVIIPFWTTNASQDSLLTISNDADRPTAIRINLLDDTGALMMALGIYLDRDDQWTAALTATGDQAGLLTADASCVVFEDGTGQAGNGSDISLMASVPATTGSIEILEMATAALESLPALSGHWPDCSTLSSRFDEGGLWADNPNSMLSSPADRISASLSILRVGEGTMSTIQGTALASFSDVALHAAPSEHEPDLSNANDLGSGNGTVRSRVCFDIGCRVDAWTDPLEAIAAVLSTISLRADFIVSPGILGKSDLVIHRPLERYESETGLFIDGPVSLELRDRNGVSLLPEDGGLRLSENQVMQVLGFEPNALFLDPPAFLPSPVLAFPVLPEFSLNALIDEGLDGGTAEVRFETPMDPGTGLIAPDGFRYAGEPVIAFGVQQFTNGSIDVGGPQPLLSNYRGTITPRIERRLDPPQF
jgi:hypothetical protein